MSLLGTEVSLSKKTFLPLSKFTSRVYMLMAFALMNSSLLLRPVESVLIMLLIGHLLYRLPVLNLFLNQLAC